VLVDRQFGGSQPGTIFAASKKNINKNMDTKPSDTPHGDLTTSCQRLDNAQGWASYPQKYSTAYRKLQHRTGGGEGVFDTNPQMHIPVCDIPKAIDEIDPVAFRGVEEHD
jgi:hypothetical protein